MAFTGVAVVKQVTDKLVRITGLSLEAAASGELGFSDKTVAPEVDIGLHPNWQPSQVAGEIVSLQDAVAISYQLVTDITVPVGISIVKTGTTHLDFAITMHNDEAAEAQDSAELEIYVELIGH